MTRSVMLQRLPAEGERPSRHRHFVAGVLAAGAVEGCREGRRGGVGQEEEEREEEREEQGAREEEELEQEPTHRRGVIYCQPPNRTHVFRIELARPPPTVSSSNHEFEGDDESEVVDDDVTDKAAALFETDAEMMGTTLTYRNMQVLLRNGPDAALRNGFARPAALRSSTAACGHPCFCGCMLAKGVARQQHRERKAGGLALQQRLSCSNAAPFLLSKAAPFAAVRRPVHRRHPAQAAAGR